jgi:outer membrane protein OmpA-like peptidoglycan-associated protein
MLSPVKSSEESKNLPGIPPLADDISSQLLAINDTSPEQGNAEPLPVIDRNAKDIERDHVLGNQHVLIVFQAGLSDLTHEQQGALQENVLPKLNKDSGLRVEIRAYAAATDDSQSSDRRIALARGLAVREYLKLQGIDTARLDIRALGKNTDRKPYDRVDIVFMQDGTPL